MKKVVIKLAFSLLFLTCFGCSDFLDVVPIDNLSGNNFWKTKDDVEAFNTSMYNRLRQATMINKPFFPATGDLRTAPVNENDQHDRPEIERLRNNSLGDLISDDQFIPLTQWKDFYEVIQLANILYEQVEELPESESILTTEEINSYQAEAVFMRNLTYFLLVRTYGDVPYYTEAFSEEALPRMDMIAVLQNGLEELAVYKDDLPWTYEDQSYVGTRASRGSIIALMMHMNMWAAGFDDQNEATYFENVVELGREIMEENEGSYELLPLEDTEDIFSGGSKEGLFEIVQNVNAGEQFNENSVYSNFVTMEPYNYYINPIINFDVEFIRDIYPPNEFDRRQELWFENLYSTDGTMQVVKFVNPFQDPGGGQTSNAGNQIVFRYTDIVLLRAEALAELGRDGEALDLVNLIRDRAEAQPVEAFGEALVNEIYWERVRELIGEGHYFYDLVRTGKVVDGAYAYAPISLSAFNEGAWTWPIHQDALNNNPFMTLNQYWN